MESLADKLNDGFCSHCHQGEKSLDLDVENLVSFFSQQLDFL